jgi:endonuclease/exonuclease/phosphatase family metal-dependent hydrolase
MTPATMPEDLPLVRLDHLWLSSQIEPISVRAVRLAGSDHQAVVADIKFRF